MVIRYEHIILVSWVAFLLIWGVSALFVKRDVPGAGDAAVWLRYVGLRLVALLILVLAVRLARRYPAVGGIVVLPPALGWAAAALTVIGIGFAMWARVSLGRNWSPRPTVKEQHELVTSGPYAFVRHPIYSGLMLATLGTALTVAIPGIVLFIIVVSTFVVRARKEEQLMLERFPTHYPAYQKHTKRLVPFVW
jgi:protein-S-isoprenylcysteine O-methyltransferase Ste14